MLEPQNIADLWNALKALADHFDLLICYSTCSECKGEGQVDCSVLPGRHGSCPKCFGGGKLYHVSAWRCSVCGKGPSANCICESLLDDDDE